MNSNVNNENLHRHLYNLELALVEIIPQYIALLNKEKLNKKDLLRLGDLEYLLFDINSRIKHISSLLQQELFGTSLDQLFKMKNLAKKGSLHSKLKYDELRKGYQVLLKNGSIFDWN